MKKNVILMLNRVFPVKHKKEGKPTMFANLLYASHKIHTVRVDASGLWAKRCEEVNSVENCKSQWSCHCHQQGSAKLPQGGETGKSHCGCAA